MNPQESLKKFLNKQQTELRRILTSKPLPENAFQAFFDQHARLHASEIAQPGLESYADVIFTGIPDETLRWIPKNGAHSIVWVFWHISRIEDVTMSILVGGKEQVLHRGDWSKLMNVAMQDTGNAMSPEEIAGLSKRIRIEALFAYRTEVGRNTREIVHQLSPASFSEKVDPARLQIIWDSKAVSEASQGLLDYWGKRNIAGLLLMPATRHNLVHLNEAAMLKIQKNKG